MEQRHLWLRSQRQQVILRVRHTVERAIRDFFDGNGFTLVDAPIFTPSACEGTSTLFEVPYFDLGKAYLTQSGQLYMEAAAMALGKAYCFGPTFRAEKSKTRRHLTEFWMVEPEVAYMDLDGDMALMEEFVSFVVQAALAKHGRELEGVLERDVSKLANVKAPFPRITYSEAVEVIQKAGHPMKWGDDIGGDEETVVASAYDRPVMVHRYPAEMKAFYFKKDPNDPRVALGCDVLAPEGYGEIIGGGQGPRTRGGAPPPVGRGAAPPRGTARESARGPRAAGEGPRRALLDGEGAQPPFYGLMRSIMRAKGMVSRTWCSPQIQATMRSTPAPKPAWGTVP